MCGLPRRFAEEFSFALAVVLTPPLIVRQTWKLLKSPEAADAHLFDFAAAGAGRHGAGVPVGLGGAAGVVGGSGGGALGVLRRLLPGFCRRRVLCGVVGPLIEPCENNIASAWGTFPLTPTLG